MYRMDAEEIDALENGEIDYAQLGEALLRRKQQHEQQQQRGDGNGNGDGSRRSLPPRAQAIINVNIGTTVKGAVDNLDTILAVLQECGYREEDFYIHCDGALFGMMIPFIRSAPMVSFKKAIGSVSVSGHKYVKKKEVRVRIRARNKNKRTLILTPITQSP